MYVINVFTFQPIQLCNRILMTLVKEVSCEGKLSETLWSHNVALVGIRVQWKFDDEMTTVIETMLYVQ